MSLKCFLDGNALCVVKEGFTNLQESDAIFLELNKADLRTLKKWKKANNKKDAKPDMADFENPKVPIEAIGGAMQERISVRRTARNYEP